MPGQRLPVSLDERDYPYTRKGGLAGRADQRGFRRRRRAHARPTSRKLTDPNYAYTPFVPPAEANVKVPAWLNSPIYYHNRGNSDFWGESSLFGDFFGLDDLMTENPRVVQGFIDIYGDWIERYRVDGFRIDTARHVNPEFWQAFVPAMLQARARAAASRTSTSSAKWRPRAWTWRSSRVTRASTSCPRCSISASPMRSGSAGRRQRGHRPCWRASTQDDGLYEGGAPAALRLPTFTGNHDFGRLRLDRRSARARRRATTKSCSA